MLYPALGGENKLFVWCLIASLQETICLFLGTDTQINQQYDGVAYYNFPFVRITS